MKQLTIIDVQQRLLRMAIEVNKICENHGIILYMIAGTMLGAIRHKGFIPWDDDMDFAISFESYDSILTFLQDELPSNYRCFTYASSDNCFVPWIKVEDTETIANDNSLPLPRGKMPGITIDIFPFVSSDNKNSIGRISKIQHLYRLNRLLFMKSSDDTKPWKNKLKTFFKAIVPFSSKQLNRRIIELARRIPSGDYFVIPMDPNYMDRYFPHKWFEPLTKYQFENTFFYGVTNYDAYLKELYHDYMALPPKEKQRVHCDNVFEV